MPSLNPSRFRAVVWVVEVDDVRPKPSWDQRDRGPSERDPGQVADRVHRHLRIVGTGLDAEVAVGPGRIEVVGREVRQPSQRRRLPTGEPEPVLAAAAEQARAEAEGDRQAGRRQPDRLAGVVGRRVVRARGRPDLAGVRPWVIRAAASVQSFSSPMSSSRESVVTSNAAKCRRSCAGVTMPAWWAP